MVNDNQPGDPEQLAKVIAAAERHYEETRRTVVVYWSETAKRYRISYPGNYDTENDLEVVRIPK